MHLWSVKPQTVRPLASLPHVLNLASERQTDTDYHFEGRYRQGEGHYLFKYTLSGEGRFRDAAGEHRMTPGRGFLCEVCDPATAYYYPDDACEPWTFVYVTFRGGPSREIVSELLQRHGPIYALDIEGDTIARLLTWETYSDTEPPIPAADGARIVMDLLMDLARSAEGDESRDPGNQLARQFRSIVRENLGRNVNIAELAEQLDVSREHLTRVFREQTSQTPYQYLRREKMLLACRLLKETSLSHKQIAARLGLAVPAHFTRTFKSVMKMTPSRFRRVGMIPMH
jgi:AraC-like DNA-binding protein